MRIHTLPTALLLGVGVLLLLVALGLLLKGMSVRRTAAGFRERAIETRASVVGIEAKDVSLSGDPDTRYFLRVRYHPNGAAEPVEAQTLTDVPAPPPRVDEEVLVAYDPQHPTRVDVAATESDAEGAGRTWLLLATGALVLALAVGAAWLVLAFIVWTA